MVDSELVNSQIQLVRELSNELAGYLYRLPDDVWRVADQFGSPCDQWKVADVITHLITGATNYSMYISRAVDGLTAPPMGYNKKSADEALLSLVSLRVER